MDPKLKEWIDNADLVSLLRRWRFAPSGDPAFVGEAGEYYARAILARHEADPAGWASASKDIGW